MELSWSVCIALAGAGAPPATGEAVDLGEASRQVAVTEGAAAAAAGARPARLCSRTRKERESEREVDEGGGVSERGREKNIGAYAAVGDAILVETMMQLSVAEKNIPLSDSRLLPPPAHG